MGFRRGVYLFSLMLLALTIISCTVPLKFDIMPKQPMELLRDNQVLTIPYKLDFLKIDVEETIKHTDYKHNVTYIFHTGKYLKSAAMAYLSSHFATYADKSIGLQIWTTYIKGERSPGETDVFQVEVTLGTRIFFDGLILYDVFTRGSAKGKNQSANEPMEEATRIALSEAIKKIPAEVAAVLSEPNCALMKLKEDMERRIKAIPIDVLIKPGFAREYISLAHLSRVTKNYEEGIAAARKALDLDPNSAVAYAILGLINKDQRKYEDAEINLKKAQELNSNWLLPDWKLAELYWETENYESAIQSLAKAQEKNPNNMATQVLLAQAFLKAGKFDKAIDTANNGIILSTTTGIGAGIISVGEYAIVEEILEKGPAKKAGLEVGDKIIKIDGQSIKGWDIDQIIQKIKGVENTTVNLTIERKGINKPFEKIILREKIIHKDAAPAFAIRALGFRELGKKKEFPKDAGRAYELNANDSWAKRAMSISYIERGKHKEALDILKTLKESPLDRLLEAIVWVKSGDLTKGIDIYSSIAEDYLVSKDFLKEIYKNELNTLIKPFIAAKKITIKPLKREGKHREAIKEYVTLLKIADEREAKEIRAHLAELIAKYPHLFQLSEEARKAVIRAEAYTEEGKFPQALEEYKKALNLSPFFPALYKALALNYAELKEYKLAIKNMNIYLELYPDTPDIRPAKDAIYKWEFMMEKGKR